MKQKTLTIYFIILVALMLVQLPILNTISILNSDEVSFKHFTKKKLFSTDIPESILNYFFYDFFKISLNSKQVIVGKDNFLFLGNQYQKVLDKTQGNYPYTIKDIGKWVQNLQNLQNWYEKKGIKFVLVIAPNKHSIYNDKLPKSVIYKTRETITNDIMNNAISKNINIVDLRDTLLRNKEKYENLLYLKTDSHWNGLGASIAYSKTISYLNNKYKVSFKIPSYTYKKIDGSGHHLAKFLKIKWLLPKDHEIYIWFDFNKKYDVCLGNINKNTQELELCKLMENPRYGINRQPKYTINNQALNKVNTLILGDSFSWHNSQLYNATFQNIWKFHYKTINGEKLSKFVNINKPDIVIYQIVERSLYNQKIVAELP